MKRTATAIAILPAALLAALALASCHPGTGPAPDRNTYTSVVPSCYPHCKSSR